MIIKQRKEPLTLQQLNVITERLPLHHKQRQLLKKETAKYQKGYNGERRVDYFLASLPDEFTILNDIAIKHRNLTIQIDSFIISPQAIYLLEIKNMSHTVTFNTVLQQCTQCDGDKTTGYQYPITQVKNIQMNLLQWLERRGLGGLPIYYFIAFAYSSTILKVIGDEAAIAKVVGFAEEMPRRIMNKNAEVKKSRQGNNLVKKKIIQTLLAESFDFQIDVFQRYHLSPADILSGVRCPNCLELAMKRIHSRWLCQKCHTYSATAHWQAIKEYELLFNRETSVKELMYFLQIESRFTANRIYKKLNP